MQRDNVQIGRMLASVVLAAASSLAFAGDPRIGLGGAGAPPGARDLGLESFSPILTLTGRRPGESSTDRFGARLLAPSGTHGTFHLNLRGSTVETPAGAALRRDRDEIQRKPFVGITFKKRF